MKRSTLPLRVPIALALAVGMAGTGLAASIVVAGAGGEARAWTTNSLVANVDVADGILISRSRADSQLAARPFSSDWTDVEAGTLFCALTVAVAPGGSASVLFGDTADPALSVDCDADWRVASAGMFLPPLVSGGWLRRQIGLNSSSASTRHTARVPLPGRGLPETETPGLTARTLPRPTSTGACRFTCREIGVQ